MPTLVTKVDGTTEPYNEEKIRTSASRVGVPEGLQDQMLQSIRDRLYDGIKTNEIFQMIKEFLKHSESPYLAMKYNLKDALSQLGPSGYPFEKYVSLLLTEVGYVTKINQTIAGSCVTHEIDVLAQKDDITYFIEAKFHKNQSQRTDVRVALYIKARYDDLNSAWTLGETRPWIFTNTRFSTDAIKYAECQKIRLTSWGYPNGQGIMDLIEHTGLHPITIIEDLNDGDKMRLLTAGVVTCKQLLDSSTHALVSKDFLDNILPQLEDICQSQ
ncbi:restriction endonuclease [Candidatus Woesebacteria bacterium]|nr:restriction endonuclease [Candidatus Woesebacteria bacterium]